ncbi:MAG: hypothetical protein M3018_12335 [Actinomycetota bacterium]|nr:hypothetical protein [Actinomycetota bacterium]
MLVGLALVIRAHDYVPRGNVTILAQVTAGASVRPGRLCRQPSVAAVLAVAASTSSFGGLPVLMSILARDHRLPHMFYLRAETTSTDTTRPSSRRHSCAR